MELTPVKLLKNGPAKRTLLKLKGENTSNIDKKDYLESRMNKLTRARELMAIEDASEMAKLYLHAGGVFEKIIRALLKESGKKVTFRCLKTSNKSKLPMKKSGLEYIMIEWMPNNGTNFGHYGMARVSHARKTVTVYDSMANSESPFENHFKKVYDGKYKIITTNKIGRPQPTGGDVKSTPAEFKKHYDLKVVPASVKKMFEISQYDELSQHHFCYIESFISFMVDNGLAEPVYKDPRERLLYIKIVVWNLVHKYVPKTKQKGSQWKYFVTNFPYYMVSRTGEDKKLELKSHRDGAYQKNPLRGGVYFQTRKLMLGGDDPSKLSLKDIMKRSKNETWYNLSLGWNVPNSVNIA